MLCLVFQRLQCHPAGGGVQRRCHVAGVQPRLHHFTEGAAGESGEARAGSGGPLVELRRPRQRELVEERPSVELDDLFPPLLLRRGLELSGVKGAALAGGVQRIPGHPNALFVQVAPQGVERLRE